MDTTKFLMTPKMEQNQCIGLRDGRIMPDGWISKTKRRPGWAI